MEYPTFAMTLHRSHDGDSNFEVAGAATRMMIAEVAQEIAEDSAWQVTKFQDLSIRIEKTVKVNGRGHFCRKQWQVTGYGMEPNYFE